MSINWRQQFFEVMNCKGVAINSGDGNITVKGNVTSETLDPIIVFWAANPTELRGSYSGSGLPYATPDQAYDRTPNYGAVRAADGYFEFKVQSPSAYYAALGTVYVNPHVHIKVCENDKEDHHVIQLGEGAPFRTLTYPAARSNENFYDQKNLPIRSQEQILYDSAYPDTNKTPDNFWGLRPAR